MGKKAIIVTSLVEESAEKSNLEIEKEIIRSFLKNQQGFWLKKVDRVTVSEA